MDAFAPAWPLYFADPELATNRAHVERLDARAPLERRCGHPLEWTATRRTTIATSRRTVSCPTLVSPGEHDFICGPVWNHALADAIPGARYVEIADAGHIPQYEQPDGAHGGRRSWLAATTAAYLNSKNETARIT